MKRMYLAAAVLIYVAASTNAYAQTCPVALPSPAEEWMVECKADENSTRCASGLPTSVCTDNNDRALALNLITQDAYDWLQANGFCAVNMEGLAMILAICPVGCFEENTAILSLSEDGAEKWVSAKDVTKDVKLFGLNVNALLSSPALDGRAIKRMSYGDEEADLFVFTLSNGNVLRVTQNHGMVLSDGRVVEAQKVIQGDRFVGLDGAEVVVEAIDRAPTSADVYNWFLDVETPQEHVIAAEGVLIGDLAWQSTLAGELDSISLRR